MSLGLAKTDNFIIGTAGVLVGPQAKLLDLTWADHGMGLVKNFTLTSEPAYTELTQGVRNTLVHSVMTSNPVRATFEMYEYTPANLKYAQGLDGSVGTTAPTTETTIATQLVGNDTLDEVTVASATGLAVGDKVIIDYGSAGQGDVLVRVIEAIDSADITFTRPIPTGVTLAVGAKVKKAIDVGIGAVEEQPFLSAMIVGPRANGKELIILLPKIRIAKGFTLAYTTDNQGNMPVELSVYDQVGTDPFVADPLFVGRKAAMVMR